MSPHLTRCRLMTLGCRLLIIRVFADSFTVAGVREYVQARRAKQAARAARKEARRQRAATLIQVYAGACVRVCVSECAQLGGYGWNRKCVG